MQQSIVNHTRAFLTRNACTDARVLVGVSGGLDSMTLLHVLNELKNSLRLELLVAHINHGLRGEDSDSDEQFVCDVCKTLDIQCEVVKVDVRTLAESSDTGIEGAARGLRYAAFDELAHKHQTPFLVIAHNRDDVAETFLLNLSRGAGLNGLASIPESRLTKGGVRLLRPFLACTRSVIAEYAREHTLVWHEDATNADIHYFRNRIRHAVLPFLKLELGSDIGEKMASASTHLRNARSIVHDAVRAASVGVAEIEDGRLVIHVEPLGRHSQPLKAEIVRRALREVMGMLASREMVSRLLALTESETGSQCSLSGSWTGLKERETIVVAEHHEKLSGPEVVVLGDGAYVAGSCTLHVRTVPIEEVLPAPGRNIAYVDADSLHGALIWRRWTSGDRFQPHGMQGTVLVSDLLTNHKVANARRAEVAVIADEDGIVWVCGIRPAERARIRATTSRVVAFTYDDINGPIVID
ncbi:MAG: tRNA lysidine(34) synthetase TilS [bacterium]|nr:tRNA lysidine(34) synthetase TilS [bacterium]